MVELVRKYTTFFPPADHPYDILLDDFEPGMKTAEVQAIFNAVRPQQVKLLKAIAARPQVKDSFLKKKFNEQKVWDFSAGDFQGLWLRLDARPHGQGPASIRKLVQRQ